MAILDFIRRANRTEMRWMLVLTVIAGFANALLVVIVNQVAGLVAKGVRPNLWAWLTFAGVFAIYYQCDKFAVLRANAVIERLLKSLRIDVVDKLRASELQVVDRLGRGNLYMAVSQGTNQLSINFPLVVESFQQGVLLAVSMIYLGYLSVPALLVFVLAVLIGFFGYLRVDRECRATLREIAQRQAEMLDAIGDIIHGSKELRLNTKRSEAVYRSYQKISDSTRTSLAKFGDHWASMVQLGNMVVYVMLGVVGFIFPQYIHTEGAIVFKLIPTLLFCVTPLMRIVAQWPMALQADVELKAILQIEHQLEAAGSVSPSEARERAGRFRDFHRIRYNNMTLSYRDAEGTPIFTVGPCDLTLARGETVFLVGGNGSGKSTVMRLITGLYPLDQGQIEVDGVRVEGREDVAGLRELFSAIFADFHLFDRLYGLEQVDAAEVRRMIGEMGLSDKVGFEDGRFTDLELSTGQRKRLALIAALLEDRPIYVFDEWSAEQDVHFREAFYTRILPGLKAKGKTVLAATHDDRFWHMADRVIRLDLGSVVWERAGAELSDEDIWR